MHVWLLHTHPNTRIIHTVGVYRVIECRENQLLTVDIMNADGQTVLQAQKPIGKVEPEWLSTVTNAEGGSSAERKGSHSRSGVGGSNSGVGKMSVQLPSVYSHVLLQLPPEWSPAQSIGVVCTTAVLGALIILITLKNRFL
jgi:hypothetical protein